MDLNDFLDDLQMWDLDCLLHGLHPPNSRKSGETGAVTNKGGADSAGRGAAISTTPQFPPVPPGGQIQNPKLSGV